MNMRFKIKIKKASIPFMKTIAYNIYKNGDRILTYKDKDNILYVKQGDVINIDYTIYGFADALAISIFNEYGRLLASGKEINTNNISLEYIIK